MLQLAHPQIDLVNLNGERILALDVHDDISNLDRHLLHEIAYHVPRLSVSGFLVLRTHLLHEFLLELLYFFGRDLGLVIGGQLPLLGSLEAHVNYNVVHDAREL